MLSARIVQIPQIDMPSPDGGIKAMDIACHMATCYWLYEESHGVAPNLSVYMNAFSNTTGLMTKIAAAGNKVSASDVSKLSAGTVLVFCSIDGTAMHSCVIRTDGKIGGYNQTGWFTSAGVSHGFSIHDIDDIRWSGKSVLLNNSAQGKLMAVKEVTAVKAV
jgi:hypothetical protein